MRLTRTEVDSLCLGVELDKDLSTGSLSGQEVGGHLGKKWRQFEVMDACWRKRTNCSVENAVSGQTDDLLL